MPFSKVKSLRRKSTYRRKKLTYARGTNPPRFLRNLMSPGNVYIKRKFYLENWAPNAASTAGFWRQWTFTINQVPDFTSLSSVFDQYKLSAIKLEFMPRYSDFSGNDQTVTLNAGTARSGTNMHVCYDTHSVVTPTGVYNSGTLNTFMEQGRIKSHTGNRPLTFYFKPVITQTIGNVSALNWRRSAFLPTTSGNIPHHGIQTFAQDINMSGLFTNTFDVFVTMYAKFKNLR